jgi:hypothetical protein
MLGIDSTGVSFEIFLLGRVGMAGMDSSSLGSGGIIGIVGSVDSGSVVMGC